MTSRLPRGRELSSYDPAFRACPHDVLERVRAAGPCYRDEEFDRVVLTGYESARRMLRRPDVSAAPARLRHRLADAEPGLFESTILQQDQPEHRLLRGVVSRAFAPPRLRRVEAAIAAAADDLLGALDGAACFDVRSAVATPLATRTMADLLGIERALHRPLAGWVHDLEAVFDPLVDAAAVARMRAAQRILLDIFRQRCQGTGEDTSGIVGQVQAAAAAGGLGVEVMAATCVLLLGAGISTSADLITNGLRLLLTHPEQLHLLRTDPALMPAAVEEALRLEPPVAQFSRIAAAGLQLEGVDVPAGAGISVSVIAAGCDPAVHENPHRFDIARPQHGHLAFAVGMHACPGRHLARMEAAIAWRKMLDRFPGLRLAAPLAERRVSLAFNGWDTLLVHPG